MEIHQHISKWGNSLGVRIPAIMAESLGIQQGDDVSITIENQAIIITPTKPIAPANFDVEVACAAYSDCEAIPDDIAEFIAMKPVGREIL